MSNPKKPKKVDALTTAEQAVAKAVIAARKKAVSRLPTKAPTIH